MADTPDVRPEGDLPTEIARTAARERAVNEITDLERVAAHSQGELPAIYGVGPRAIRLSARRQLRRVSTTGIP